jgi:hypothetical protein
MIRTVDERKSIWKRDASEVEQELAERFLRWLEARWWHHALLAIVGLGSVALTVWLVISG